MRRVDSPGNTSPQLSAESQGTLGLRLPWHLQAFGEIAKRAGQDKIVFHIYFHVFHKNIQGRGRRHRKSMGWDVVKGL
jgi:hypothetical protein